VRRRRLSTRDARPSPLVSSPPGQRRGEQLCAGRRRGEAAACWRRLSTRGARPSPLVSVAAWTAARRGGCTRAPPLDSRRPSVASRLIAVWTVARRAAVRWTAAQLGSSALAPPLDSRRPSVASRLVAAWTAARRAAVRWTAARRGSCVPAPPLDSRRPSVASRLCRRLDSGAASGAASSCALDGRAARQLCAGAASRLEAPVRRLSSLSPPVQRRGEQLYAGRRRGEAAACLRRLSTRGARPSPLVSSPSGQWRGEQRCAGQRRS